MLVTGEIAPTVNGTPRNWHKWRAVRSTPPAYHGHVTKRQIVGD